MNPMIQNLMALPEKLSRRQWGTGFAVVSLAVLGAAYFSQYVLGMQPCKLCLIQRIPYAVTTVLGIAILIFAARRSVAAVLFGLLAVAFLASTGLALFHFGVEQKWWTYASDCTGQNVFKPGASVEEMMAALRRAPTVRCDEAVPFLFGMSMAFYNILVSAGLAFSAAYALYLAVKPSRSAAGE